MKAGVAPPCGACLAFFLIQNIKIPSAELVVMICSDIAGTSILCLVGGMMTMRLAGFNAFALKKRYRPR
jgi:hypothetical protein